MEVKMSYLITDGTSYCHRTRTRAVEIVPDISQATKFPSRQSAENLLARATKKLKGFQLVEISSSQTESAPDDAAPAVLTQSSDQEAPKKNRTTRKQKSKASKETAKVSAEKKAAEEKAAEENVIEEKAAEEKKEEKEAAEKKSRHSRNSRRSGRKKSSAAAAPEADVSSAGEVPAVTDEADVSSAEEAPAVTDEADVSSAEEAPAVTTEAEVSPTEEAPAATVEEDASPADETPDTTAEEDASPADETPDATVEEDASPADETPASAVEEDASPADETPSAAADLPADADTAVQIPKKPKFTVVVHDVQYVQNPSAPASDAGTVLHTAPRASKPEAAASSEKSEKIKASVRSKFRVESHIAGEKRSPAKPAETVQEPAVPKTVKTPALKETKAPVHEAPVLKEAKAPAHDVPALKESKTVPEMTTVPESPAVSSSQEDFDMKDTSSQREEPGTSSGSSRRNTRRGGRKRSGAKRSAPKDTVLQAEDIFPDHPEPEQPEPEQPVSVPEKETSAPSAEQARMSHPRKGHTAQSHASGFRRGHGLPSGGSDSRRRLFTTQERNLIYNRTEGHCGICGRFIPLEEYTIDHIIPLSKGGTNDLDNLQACCSFCNKAKDDSLGDEFFDRITRIFLYQAKLKYGKKQMKKFKKALKELEDD